MNLPSHIVKRIEFDFKAHQGHVWNLIDNYMAQTRLESHRVLRCALFLSKGDPANLEEMIHTATIDYRNVIFWAEYTAHEKDQPKRIRDFSRPFGDHCV